MSIFYGSHFGSPFTGFGGGFNPDPDPSEDLRVLEPFEAVLNKLPINNMMWVDQSGPNLENFDVEVDNDFGEFGGTSLHLIKNDVDTNASYVIWSSYGEVISPRDVSEYKYIRMGVHKDQSASDITFNVYDTDFNTCGTAQFNVGETGYAELEIDLENPLTPGFDPSKAIFQIQVASDNVGQAAEFHLHRLRAEVARGPDPIPDEFLFSELTDQELSEVVYSDIVQITGINVSLPVTVSGGNSVEYRTCEDSACENVIINWTDEAGTIGFGDYLQLAQETSGTPVTLTDVSVSVGSYSTDWEVTTRVKDETPAAFNFTPLTDQDPDDLVVSNIVQITGIDDGCPISAEGIDAEVRYCADGACSSVLMDWTAGDSLPPIDNNVYIQVRDYTEDDPGETSITDVTVGTYATTWSKTVALSYTPMGNVVASCVFDLDATIAASYPGTGQTVANIEPTPADSSTPSDNDIWLGVGSGSSSDDPTFTGTADDPGAYFAMDGGDYFTFKQVSAFLNTLHKTASDKDWWIAFSMRTVRNAGAQQTLLYTRDPNNMSVTIGMILDIQTSHNIRHLVTPNNGSSTSVATESAPILDATDSVIIISRDASAGTTTWWLNSDTGANLTLSPSTADIDIETPPTIGAFTGGSNPLSSGTRMYGISGGNEYLDNTKAAAIRAQYLARRA